MLPGLNAPLAAAEADALAAGGRFITGLATNPLFTAGMDGLSGKNPLDSLMTGMAVEAREREQARAQSLRQQEAMEMRVLGAELARIAEESGSERLQDLVRRGPSAFGEAVQLVNMMGSAQEDFLTPQQVDRLFEDQRLGISQYERLEFFTDSLGRVTLFGIRDGGATIEEIGEVGTRPSGRRPRRPLGDDAEPPSPDRAPNLFGE